MSGSDKLATSYFWNGARELQASRSERLVWADNTRGMAIVLVVLGHALIPEAAKAVIYGFHMHLFFFLSGAFFSPGRSFMQFALNKARTLLLPYLFFGLVAWGIWILRVTVLHGGESGAYLFQPLRDLLMLGQYWFLPVLFVVSLLFRQLYPWVTMTLLPVLVAGCALVHHLFEGYALVPYAGTLVHAVNALGFYAAGHVFRSYGLQVRAAVAVAAAVVFALAFHWGYPVYGMETIGHVDNYAYAYLLAFCGILLAIFAGGCMPRNAVFSFLGANSLLIYLLHGYPGAISSRLFAYMGITPAMLPPMGFGLLQTVVNLLLLTPALIVVSRYMPWTLGRSGGRQ